MYLKSADMFRTVFKNKVEGFCFVKRFKLLAFKIF